MQKKKVEQNTFKKTNETKNKHPQKEYIQYKKP